MKVTITPKKLAGSVNVPGSKSIAHRALILASQIAAPSTITGLPLSEDIFATVDCLRALGADILLSGSTARVRAGKGGMPGGIEIPCRESGSTLRFLLPLALAKGGSFTFTGIPRLFARPLEEYFEMFRAQGIAWQENPLRVQGKMEGGGFSLRGDRSSQFASGLLMAFAGQGEVSLSFTTPLESRPYLRLTLRALADFGLEAKETENGAYARGSLKAANVQIEPDFSQAAFWLTANALGSRVHMHLPQNSAQGDAAALALCKGLPQEVFAEDIPDLVPVLAVLATQCAHPVLFRGAGRLRFKECDRLQATAQELSRLGADIRETKDGLSVNPSALTGGETESHNDHRIAMAMAIAATAASGPVVIHGAESVRKSYPAFWEDYKALGGEFIAE